MGKLIELIKKEKEEGLVSLLVKKNFSSLTLASFYRLLIIAKEDDYLGELEDVLEKVLSRKESSLTLIFWQIPQMADYLSNHKYKNTLFINRKIFSDDYFDLEFRPYLKKGLEDEKNIYKIYLKKLQNNPYCLIKEVDSFQDLTLRLEENIEKKPIVSFDPFSSQANFFVCLLGSDQENISFFDPYLKEIRNLRKKVFYQKMKNDFLIIEKPDF